MHTIVVPTIWVSAVLFLIGRLVWPKIVKVVFFTFGMAKGILNDVIWILS